MTKVKRIREGINLINFFTIFLWGLFFFFIIAEFLVIKSSWIGWIFLPVFVIFNLIFFFIALFATLAGGRR